MGLFSGDITMVIMVHKVSRSVSRAFFVSFFFFDQEGLK